MNEPSSLFQTAFGRQRGAALLIFMLIFFMASMSLLLSSANLSSSRVQADQTSSDALAQAKAALLARAAATSVRPGSLPCPDFNDDGEDKNGSCSETNTIGRLPWKTLGLDDLRDGDGNRLWYVLAKQLRNSSTSKINPTTALELSMDGASNIAAIVFSPGPPLAGKNGRPSNNIKDYLDDANNEGGPYISGPISPTFNDRAIVISHSELFSIVNRRILGLLGVDLDTYYADESLYPYSSTGLKTSLKSLVSKFESELKDVSLVDEKKKKLEKRIAALNDRIAMLDENGWFAITSYSSSPDRQTATLAITVPPTLTCTLVHTQRLVCTQP